MKEKMNFNFSDYLTRIDEKLNNLNASSDPKYNFLLKTVLKNDKWFDKDIFGPKSKIVTMIGKGQSQFVKDLRSVQRKIGDPQLVFVTTEYKTVMIRMTDSSAHSVIFGKQIPIKPFVSTYCVVVSDSHIEKIDKNLILPKTEIEKNILAARSAQRIVNLKTALDNAALDGDDVDYHAVVILPDLELVNKNSEKYHDAIKPSSNVSNIVKSTSNISSINSVSRAKSYNLKIMKFKDVHDILKNPNNEFIIDDVSYKIDSDIEKGQFGYKLDVDMTGGIHICDMIDSDNMHYALSYQIEWNEFHITKYK